MKRRIIDLTFLIHEGMTTYPSHWHPFVEVTQLGRHGIENRETRKFVLGTHTGTHCDAPRHFIPGGMTIEDVPLDLLIGPAEVVNLSDLGPARQVEVGDLEARLPSGVGRRVLLRYDWSDRWGKMEYYTDHPFLSESAAHWLADAGVELIGMDTPTPDNPAHGWKSEKDSPVHKILLGQGLILVEYLANLRKLRGQQVELVVLPLRLKDGDGAPARCIAIEQN